MKRFEALVAKTKPPRLLYYFIAFWLLGIAFVIGGTFGVQAIILQNLQVVQISFQGVSELTKIRYYLGQTITGKVEEVAMMNCIMMVHSLGRDAIGPINYDVCVQLVKKQHAILPQLLKDPDYLGFEALKAEYSLQGIKRFSETFFASEKYLKSPLEFTKKLSAWRQELKDERSIDYLSSRYSSKPVNPNINLHQLSLFLVGRLKNGALYLKELSPYITGKSFPFQIPLSLKIAYFKVIWSMVGCIKVLFSGVPHQLAKIFDEGVEETLQKLPHLYQSYFWGLSSGTFCSCILFCFISLTIANFVEKSFKKIFLAYEHLRTNELDFLLAAYQKFISTIEASQHSEAHFLSSFDQIGQTRGRIILDYVQSDKKMSRERRRDKKKQNIKVRIRITNQSFLRNFKVVAIFSVIMVLYVFLNFLPMLILRVSFDNNTKLQRLYFDSLKKYDPISFNFVAFSTMITFGSFLKMSSVYPKDYVDHQSVENFNKLSYIPQLENHRLFPASDIKKLNDILFGNICQHFQRRGTEQSLYLKKLQPVCYNFPPAQKGLVNILFYESSLINSKRKQLLSDPSFQAYLETTKKNYTVSKSLLTFLSKEIIELRLIHDAVGAVFMEHFFLMMDSYHTELFSLISHFIEIYKSVAIALMSLIVILYGRFAWKSLWHTRNLAHETLTLILPEVVSTNPLISHILKKELIQAI